MDESKTILDRLREMEEEYDYDMDELFKISDEIEEAISAKECWNTLKGSFSDTELLENLIYLATEHDL